MGVVLCVCVCVCVLLLLLVVCVCVWTRCYCVCSRSCGVVVSSAAGLPFVRAFELAHREAGISRHVRKMPTYIVDTTLLYNWCFGCRSRKRTVEETTIYPLRFLPFEAQI